MFVSAQDGNAITTMDFHANTFSEMSMPTVLDCEDFTVHRSGVDAQRPEGQVVQQSRSFQSNQPIPNPSRDRTEKPVVRTDRSGQPVVGTNTRTVQDGRKTSRSQEIDASSFHEEAVSSDRTGQPVVETSRIQTRSSDDSKSLNVEMAHDRTVQPVVETNT